MSCNKCGMCCKAIRMIYSMDYIKSVDNGDIKSDANFIVNNWEAISEEEALSINPYLIESLNKSKNNNPNLKFYFYKCHQFDHENNLCKVHNISQPRICYGYPFYDRKDISKDEAFYSKDCGYNDVKYFKKDNEIEK